MLFYDYTQIPLHVADAAFAEFVQNLEQKSILDLLEMLIRHCDAWCAANAAVGEADQRVAVLTRLQAYLHERYATELTALMSANILRYRQQHEIQARLYERKN